MKLLPVLFAPVLVIAVGVPAAADVTPTPTPTPTVVPEPKPSPKYRREPVKVRITPDSGRFGVGQLITAEFSSAVRWRAKAEAGMTVTSNKALPAGSWAWISNTKAVYRPRTFWPGHARIDVTLDLRAVPLNRDATTRWVGGVRTDRVQTWHTGRSQISRIDGKNHQMRVYRDDQLIKLFGVSLGKAGFLTRSGVKVLTGEKYRWQRMTSQELGLVNESYDLQVPYAVRLTPSGEFIHGAPWADYRIGVYNGSHGCTNLHVSDARWFYHHTKPGDVTVTTRTGRAMETWNGTPGSYWNYSWAQWREMSALR